MVGALHHPSNQPTNPQLLTQAECRRVVLGSHFGITERVPCHLGCDVCQRRHVGIKKDDPVDFARWADDFRRRNGLGGGGGGGSGVLGSKRPMTGGGAAAAASKQARTDGGGEGWLRQLDRGGGSGGGNSKKGFAAAASSRGGGVGGGENDENAREIEVLSLSE